tara:strand:+ start:2164 stop:3351 length:1188 start_codon:yes stop_codon:yes gene_type:complete
MSSLETFPDISRSANVIHTGTEPLPKRERGGSIHTVTNNEAQTYGPGSELLLIYKKAKVPSCQSCKDLARRMDKWGPTICRERINEIVAEITPRAIAWVEGNRPWIHALLPNAIEHAVIKNRVRANIDAAINAAEEKVKSKRGPNVIARHIRKPITELLPTPFTDTPSKTLLCHCWANGNNWRKHIDLIEPVKDDFERKIMSVATGPGTASFEEVKHAFGDSWEYTEYTNDPKKREVLTYTDMMKDVESTDPNEVTFCIHTKGTQDNTSKKVQVQWWTEAMYETVVHNWREVLKKFEEGYNVAGSFRRNGAHFKTRYGWHYTGTFYAFRNSETFSQGVPTYDKQWWGTESWVGQHFSKEESACMFADECGDIYKPSKDLEQQLIDWRLQNGNILA